MTKINKINKITNWRTQLFFKKFKRDFLGDKRERKKKK